MKISKRYKDNLKNLPKLTKKQLDNMHEIERDAFARFTGLFGGLEAAIGMLRMGHYVGWKVLIIIHNKRTIKKYEEILDINIKEYFDKEGPLANRSFGYSLFKEIGQFWKIVSGDIKVEKRKEIE